jgi:hypothetical protein
MAFNLLYQCVLGRSHLLKNSRASKYAFAIILQLVVSSAFAGPLADYLKFSLRQVGSVEAQRVPANMARVNVSGQAEYYHAGYDKQLDELSVTTIHLTDSKSKIVIMPLVRSQSEGMPLTIDFFVELRSSGFSTKEVAANELEAVVKNISRQFPDLELWVKRLGASSSIAVDTPHGVEGRFDVKLPIHPQVMITARNAQLANGRDSRFWVYTMETRNGSTFKALSNRNNIENAALLMRDLTLKVAEDSKLKTDTPCEQAVMGSDVVLNH